MPHDLLDLFGDLVRLETELWADLDATLRRTHDLALSWFEVMRVIDATPDCRVLDIQRALSITVGGASKVVDRVADAALCERCSHPTDARSSIITLTPLGRATLQAATTTVDERLVRLVGTALPAPALAEFAATARMLRERLHATHPEGTPR